MATKSFLKSVNIKGRKQVRDFARALDELDKQPTFVRSAVAYELPKDKLSLVFEGYGAKKA